MKAKKTIILAFLFLGGISPGIAAQEITTGTTPDLLPVDDESELMDEFAFLMEEEIIFSASKHQQQISDSPATVTVITREQIENTHCVEITCLLRQVPEIEVRRVMPMYHSVGARALASEQADKALVLIDGREEAVESFGMPFWMALPVHLEEIERIEIVRGPGSALYGANAHSMVVAITTRKIEPGRAEVFLGAGEHDRNSLNLQVDQAFGDWRLRLSGGLDTADHWRRQDDPEKDLYRVSLRLERHWEDATTGLQLGLIGGEGDTFSLLAPNRLRDAYLGHAMLFHHSEWLRGHVWFHAFGNDSSLDLPLYFGELQLGTFPEWMSMLTLILDGDVQVTRSFFEDNLLIAGVNYRWLGMELGGNEEAMVHQHRIGFFVQDEHRFFDQLTVTGAVRFDYNSITPETFSPRLAAVWRFLPTQVVRLAFGRAFRKPSFFNTSVHLTTIEGTAAFPDMKDFFQRSVGNDDLGNESVTSIEAGYRGRFFDGALTVESDAFFNLYRDTIAFAIDLQHNNLGVPDLSRSKFRFENQGLEVNTIGGSVSVTYRIKESLRLAANYTYRFSYYISPSGSGLRDKGDRVPWEPAHLFNASATYLARRGLRVGVAAHARSAFEEPWPADGGLFSDQVMIPAPAAVFFSAFLSWRFDFGSSWFEAGVRAYDLLGTGFRDLTAVTRFDGVRLGGQLLGRRIFAFLRAGL